MKNGYNKGKNIGWKKKTIGWRKTRKRGWNGTTKEWIEKQQRKDGEDQHRKDAKEQQKNGNNERVERESTDELRKQIQWRHKKVEGARDVLPKKFIGGVDTRFFWIGPIWGAKFYPF